MHFVTICDKFRQIRQSTFEKIQNVCPNFNMLSNEDKFNYIMNSGGTVLKAELIHFKELQLPKICRGTEIVRMDSNNPRSPLETSYR